MNKLTIELELLTPLKYEEALIWLRDYGMTFLKVTDIYKTSDNAIKNTKKIREGIPENMVDAYIKENELQKCILIGSSEIRDIFALQKSVKQFKGNENKGIVLPIDYQSDVEPEFKGLHKFEENVKNYCILHYIVKNPTPEISSFLKSFSLRKKSEYYVLRSDLDNATADVFGDMFGEL